MTRPFYGLLCSYLPQKYCEQANVLQSINILILVCGQRAAEQAQALLTEAGVQDQDPIYSSPQIIWSGRKVLVLLPTSFLQHATKVVSQFFFPRDKGLYFLGLSFGATILRGVAYLGRGLIISTLFAHIILSTEAPGPPQCRKAQLFEELPNHCKL